MSARLYYYTQLVAAGLTNPDSRYVINVNSGVTLSDGTTLTPQQVTWWAGGATAGAQYNEDLTYATYPGAVDVTTKLTNSGYEQAIQNGELVLWADDGAVKVEYGGLSAWTGLLNGIASTGAKILLTIQDIVNGAIDQINFLINGVNNIVGTSFSVIEHVTFGTEAAIKYQAGIDERNDMLASFRGQMLSNQAYRQAEIWLAKSKTSPESDLSQYTTGIPSYDEIASTLGDISGSVKGIEKTVSMSDEDIKALVDVAEQRYVNQVNLTSQTPVITVNGANTGRTQQDRQALADAIELILREQLASGAARSTAYA